jgi:hypothetical protein
MAWCLIKHRDNFTLTYLKKTGLCYYKQFSDTDWRLWYGYHSLKFRFLFILVYFVFVDVIFSETTTAESTVHRSVSSNNRQSS